MPSYFQKELFELNHWQWDALGPYLWLCVGIALATIAAGLKASKTTLRLLHVFVLSPYIAWLLWQVRDLPVNVFGSSLELDGVTKMVGAVVGVFALMASLFSRTSHETKHAHAEWSPLMLLSVLGLSLLPAARDWISFFVYLELLSVSGYVLAALDTQRERSLEAGTKYLLMGAFSSGFLLMGVALLFGATGSFHFLTIATNLSQGAASTPFAIAGALLVLVALGFKVALVPFHMWAADVYQAAPTGLAAYLASATKISIFAAMAVAFHNSGLWEISAFRESAYALSIVTIIIGNLLAIAQDKLRRVLAYSSVANAGYASLALVCGFQSTGSLLTSLAIYGVGVIAALSSIEMMVRSAGKNPHSDLSLQELAESTTKASASSKIVLSLAIFSLAGIPPLPGFLGKYVVLSEAWSMGLYWGVGAMILGSLLGLAYYLRIFVPLYMKTAEGSQVKVDVAEPAGFAPQWVGILAAIVLVFLLTGFGRMNSWMNVVEGLAR